MASSSVHAFVSMPFVLALLVSIVVSFSCGWLLSSLTSEALDGMATHRVKVRSDGSTPNCNNMYTPTTTFHSRPSAQSQDILAKKRLIIINTMTYEHIYRRPNLARTAAQLKVAGDGLLWVIVEDTHSLRKMNSSVAQYEWVLKDTLAFIETLGVPFEYLHPPSPFPPNAPRSPTIESYQRNLALNYSYSVISDVGLRKKHNCTCELVGARGDEVKALWKSNRAATKAIVNALFDCPVVYIADDDNVYMPSLFPTLRKVMHVALFPTGNMGYDGIEGPIVKPNTNDDGRSLQGRVVGFNVWHGSDPKNPKGWDKNGAGRRFKGDMAGLAFNAALTPHFTGPRYGYHETNIVEQTGVVELQQIEGSTGVHAHHIHNGPANGRLCYPIDWDYVSTTNLWFNTKMKRTFSTRRDACDGCAPDAGVDEFRGCSKK
eukprot:m.208633 g.208633  ORF g.208633 m.208633 type:complete len:431 (+) comp33016_c0_seq2:252-1544(+)